ncbi:hypothetical protein F2981_16615 [Sinorhizobium meliloti]|nr:hypothetical protein [Sinorhizobium meliloti]
MKQLIWDCQKDIAAYLPTRAAFRSTSCSKRLSARLDGRQAKEALGDDWQGWWPDDDDGDGDDSPLPQQPLPSRPESCQPRTGLLRTFQPTRR